MAILRSFSCFPSFCVQFFFLSDVETVVQWVSCCWAENRHKVMFFLVLHVGDGGGGGGSLIVRFFFSSCNLGAPLAVFVTFFRLLILSYLILSILIGTHGQKRAHGFDIV